MTGTHPRGETARVSPRLLVLVLLATSFFVFGLFDSQPIIFLSVTVMSLIGFLLLSLSPPHTDVEVTRILETTRITEGDSCRVLLRVKNLQPRRIATLQIRDLLPSELDRRSVKNGFTIQLAGGETRELSYGLRPKYFGTYSLGPIAVSAEDVTGFMEVRTTIESRSSLIVTPQTAGRLTRFSIRPRRTRSQPGSIPSRRTGAGLDFYNVRQFIAGESVKRVNWRATARLIDEHSLMVNDYIAELGADVMLIVEARNPFGPQVSRDPILSGSVRAALSIADRLLRDKNRVGLLAIGSWTERLTPAYGIRQFNRIAVALAKLRPSDSFGVRSVPSTLHHFFPRVSQVVLISPLSDNTIFGTAAELVRDKSFDTMILSPSRLSVATKESLKRLRRREWAAARRLLLLQRRAKLSELRAAGAAVVDWNAAEPLAKILGVSTRAFQKPITVSPRR